MASPDDPSPDDLIEDGELRQLVDSLCMRPSMYVNPPNAESVLTFIDGYVHARNGGPLVGFKQWLVVRQDGGNNLAWSGLALDALEDIDAKPTKPHDDPRLAKLNALFKEFFEYRRSNGVTKVFDDYAKWLRRRSWYTGPLRRK